MHCHGIDVGLRGKYCAIKYKNTTLHNCAKYTVNYVLRKVQISLTFVVGNTEENVAFLFVQNRIDKLSSLR